MFDYTRAALNKTVADLKRVAFWFTVIMQLAFIGFPIYSIGVGSGNIYINILLSATALVFLIFYVVQGEDSSSKKRSIYAKRVSKTVKYISKLYNIGVAVYAVYVASEHTTLVSLIYLGFTVIILLISVSLDLIVSFCQKRIELITTALEADFEVVTKPLGKVQGAVNWMRGRERERNDEPTASEIKARKYLDEQVSEYRAEKKRKRAEERADSSDTWKKRIKALFKRKAGSAPQELPQPEDEPCGE